MRFQATVLYGLHRDATAYRIERIKPIGTDRSMAEWLERGAPPKFGKRATARFAKIQRESIRDAEVETPPGVVSATATSR